MRLVRDGKIYDTETAKEIHSKYVELPAIDPDEFFVEALFLSPEGQCFTLWATKPMGNIELIDRSSVADWLQKVNAPASAYEAAGIEIGEG